MYSSLIVSLICFLFSSQVFSLPNGFAYLEDIDASIPPSMMYYQENNFVGEPIAGYSAPKCILTTQATEQLAKLQRELTEYGLFLIVYDCYRPQ